MGEAKRRGDYEKRKAEAIKAGRVKKSKDQRPVPVWSGRAVINYLLGKDI